MNLHNFLHFNNGSCPICQNPLTLYLQWLNGPCFKASKITYKWRFQPFKNSNHKFNHEYLDLLDLGSLTEIQYGSSEMAQEAKRRHMYFFYLCNPDGFKDVGQDYEINIYKGCYWRSTPLLEHKKYLDESHCGLETINPDEKELINGDEIFSFKKSSSNEERVYTLQINYAEDKTGFMFYSLNDEQKKNEFFEPNIFDKTMPMLGARPDFTIEHRDKLIDRFDSWILMS